MKFLRYSLVLTIFVGLGLFNNNTFLFSNTANSIETQSPQIISQTISAPKLTVRPTISYPGDTVLVQASQPGMIEFNGTNYRLHPEKEGYILFLPISIEQTPGEIDLFYHQEQKQEPENSVFNPNTIKAKIEIKEKAFSTQYLEVTSEQQEMYKNTEKINQDRKKVEKALSNPIEEPYFSGKFVQPLEGRISTMYGYSRYINGELDSRHLAIDIAAPEGTPILAPNNGKVVLADYLYLSGNRVIIDHGSYLFSSFSHLIKLNVQTGDTVKKGDIIGWVGSTGFSTGPHLHHAMYVHGFAVNPELFFGSDPFSW